MDAAKCFQDLIVWQKAHALVIDVYRRSALLPKTELYGLISQMRRAAVSVPANLAEGFRRRGKLDKTRMMNIAQGSLEELRYYFILSHDLGYLDTASLQRQAEEVSRLLDSYVRRIELSSKRG